MLFQLCFICYLSSYIFGVEPLKGQIAICILLSLPIPTSLVTGGGHAILVAHILSLLIPLFVFCVLFWIKNSKGSDFKVTRIIIATLLWGACWIGYYLFYGNFIELIYWLEKVYGFDMFVALFASYNAMAIAMVMIFSYVIGKWINGKRFLIFLDEE